MWICSKMGFFSIVAHKEEKDQFLIRWRFEEECDVVRYLLPRVVVQETPKADYAFRCTVTRERMQRFVAALADGIDYPNFKNEAARWGQDKKLPAYHELWHSMRGAQLREAMERARGDL